MTKNRVPVYEMYGVRCGKYIPYILREENIGLTHTRARKSKKTPYTTYISYTV